ncbi:hypothetical protein [Arthrobacter sp. H14]|uniref:hypothetical protein n=1 Tax=Arthrobacter sp. H14 TaxID=1312959 RepID=UPI00047A4062|nr:hypothetical protein [Arthrobacter sp. H14]
MSNHAAVHRPEKPSEESVPETTHLVVSVVLDLKPGTSQTQAEASMEFLTLFREYLTAKDGSFQTDYGPAPWGGYEGPTVTSVTVLGSEESR